MKMIMVLKKKNVTKNAQDMVCEREIKFVFVCVCEQRE